ncbi:MauE/DoxX family redox-associated membrane protein [Kytococcus sp. Marseille-QA3725]
MSDTSLLPDAAAGAGVLLAAMYGTSGVTKLGAPESTESAFHQLRLPAWLVRMKAPALLGPGEILLALALLLLPAPWYWLPAVAALLLGIVYTVLIVRALGFDVPVTCGCFGALGQGEVTRSTVVRNLVLVALGVVTVADAAAGGSVIGRLLTGTGLWWWLPVLAAAVALTWLIGGGSSSARDAGAVRDPQPGDEAVTQEAPQEELDYLRTPIPYVQVESDEGPLHLRDLARQKAWLVLYVSLGCGGCTTALERAEEFAEEFPHVGVLTVTTTPSAPDHPARPEHGVVAYDEDQRLRQTMQLWSTPTAFVMGADGLLAGGPVAGGSLCVRFMDEISEELRTAAE